MITNLHIWDEVKNTNPQFTKAFKRDGWEGTAIDSLHTIQRATELFGPCGLGWGYSILDENIVTDPVSHDLLHFLRVELWWSYEGEEGKVIGQGGTKMAYTTGDGYRITDDDAVKKSLTDAITNAFAKLGFSADVRLGMFDDVKYVEAMRKKFGNKPADPPPDEPETLPEEKQPESAVDLKKLLRANVSLWSGVAPDDLDEAVRTTIRAAGFADMRLKKAQVQQVIEYVKKNLAAKADWAQTINAATT